MSNRRMRDYSAAAMGVRKGYQQAEPIEAKNTGLVDGVRSGRGERALGDVAIGLARINKLPALKRRI